MHNLLPFFFLQSMSGLFSLTFTPSSRYQENDTYGFVAGHRKPSMCALVQLALFARLATNAPLMFSLSSNRHIVVNILNRVRRVGDLSCTVTKHLLIKDPREQNKEEGKEIKICGM